MKLIQQPASENLFFMCHRGGFFFRPAAVTGPHAHSLQDDFQRAEPRKRGLEQVKTDKRREPQPIRAVIMGQQQADEYETPRESANNHFHID